MSRRDQTDPASCPLPVRQYQGNAYVVLYPGNRSPLEFEFPASEQNLTYQANEEVASNFQRRPSR